MDSGSRWNLDTVRTAFERHEFFLVYQPIVSLQDGRCFGAEALIRWRLPGGGGVVDGVHFMPITDRTPFSGLITYWVIDTVAADLSDWLWAHSHASVALNIPAEILGRGGLTYAVSKSGLLGLTRQMVLEITERSVPDQLGLDALNSIPETGARVALDGVTFSGANLALLMRCHFDFVKIDPALVGQIGGDPELRRPAWLQGLAALHETTALQTIAEGVDTAAQHEVLRSAGVQWGQGDHLSSPLSADGFKRYYARSWGAPD